MSPRLAYLLEKYLNKTHTEQEMQELAEIVLNSERDEEINKLLEKFWNELDASESMPDAVSRSVVQSILQTEAPQDCVRRSKVISMGNLKRLWVAASVVLIVGTGLYLLFSSNGSDRDKKHVPVVARDVKAPAGNKAVIVMNDGSNILLDSISRAPISIQGNVSVTKTGDGRVAYKGTTDVIINNTLINPRGSKVVNITLQDGTTVWLNCESTIRYPIAFTGKERTVEITGEAYLEVAKDPSRKFIVIANGARTEVLGTHFNVNAYGDAGHTNITLLEGSIKVFNNGSTALLTPNQQAQLYSNSKINVINHVEASEVVAWKNGLFSFNSLPLKNIMQQLERWYNVTVVYENVTNDKHFTGIFSRSNNVSEVLKVMQLAGIKFKVEGEKITVTE